MSRSRKQRKVKRRDRDWWIPILLATLTTVSSVAGCMSQMAR